MSMRETYEKSITDKINDMIKKIDSIPPLAVRIEMSKIAWEIVSRNINELKEFSDYITNVEIVVVEGDRELGINKARVVFDKGEYKMLTIFNWNYDLNIISPKN